MVTFKVRDFRNKGFFLLDDEYLNGYVKLLGTTASMVYIYLCRCADKNQTSFPSQEQIAEKLGINHQIVKRKIKELSEWNLIAKEQGKSLEGKWRHNTYFLIDKTEWKKPQVQILPSVQKVPKPQVQNIPLKDTHIKDTHILSKDNTKPNGFGNQDINYLTYTLKQKLNLPLLDGSQKQNRQYAQLLIKKFGGKEKVALIIEGAARSPFWSTKITSFQGLYYKAMQIISDSRNMKGGVVDARNL